MSWDTSSSVEYLSGVYVGRVAYLSVIRRQLYWAKVNLFLGMGAAKTFGHHEHGFVSHRIATVMAVLLCTEDFLTCEETRQLNIY